MKPITSWWTYKHNRGKEMTLFSFERAADGSETSNIKANMFYKLYKRNRVKVIVLLYFVRAGDGWEIVNILKKYV